MRQYAWYCLDWDAIVLQIIMEDCRIAFEWGHEDLIYASKQGTVEPTSYCTFIPLGEI